MVAAYIVVVAANVGLRERGRRKKGGDEGGEVHLGGGGSWLCFLDFVGWATGCCARTMGPTRGLYSTPSPSLEVDPSSGPRKTTCVCRQILTSILCRCISSQVVQICPRGGKAKGKLDYSHTCTRWHRFCW